MVEEDPSEALELMGCRFARIDLTGGIKYAEILRIRKVMFIKICIGVSFQFHLNTLISSLLLANR